MARVECEIIEVEMKSEDTGLAVPGICARCGDCGHETESYGTGEASICRCLVLLREECPEGRRNFYVDESE